MFTHSFPFDPQYAYNLEALLRVGSPQPPADFTAFWRDTYHQALATSLDLELKELPRRPDQARVLEVRYTGLGGFRVGAFLRVPRQAVTRGVVVGHGYGGREGPDLWVPGEPAAAIFPCARGMGLSAASTPAVNPIPDQANLHVLHGLESRESYIHRFCVADLWSAVSVLQQLYPQITERVDYLGGSFGGGIGALAIPWEPRFRRAALFVPSFGNHPLRVTLDCTGSGAAVRQRWREEPAILNVLRYFDAASAARSITIPTLVVAALFDPAVPPPGQFAVFNAIPAPRQLIVRQAGHFDYAAAAAEDQMINNTLDAWFRLP